jgi:transcription initiation factor TFIID subunit 7
LSDSEFIEREEPLDAPTPAFSEGGDAPTPGDGEDSGSDDDNDEPEGDIDEELAAELDLALGDEEDDDGDDEEDDDESDEDEEDDDDDDETTMARKLLNEEIRDLQSAVDRKSGEISKAANPLIKVPHSMRPLFMPN